MKKPTPKTLVLFACVHNAGRSQMAAALFNHLCDPRLARALSAGTCPADVIHPVVQEAMAEIGLDLSEKRPQQLTPELAEGVSLLVTMGCGESCPHLPDAKVEDWPLEDPKEKPLERVREIREMIRAEVQGLLLRLGYSSLA